MQTLMQLDWYIFFSTISNDLLIFGLLCIILGGYRNWKRRKFFYKTGERPTAPEPNMWKDAE